MKKHAFFWGLVFVALVFVSCKLEKGGTIEVTNGSPTDSAHISIMQGKDGDLPVTEIKKAAANGGRVTFPIDEDGTYTVNAAFYSGSTASGHGKEYAVLSGGNKVTVNVKPSP